MIVDCPSCDTTFPVDPNKVPVGGVHARCSVCSDVFFVEVTDEKLEPAGMDVPTADYDAPTGEEWAAVDEGAFEAEPPVTVETEPEPDWRAEPVAEEPDEEPVWEAEEAQAPEPAWETDEVEAPETSWEAEVEAPVVDEVEAEWVTEEEGETEWPSTAPGLDEPEAAVAEEEQPTWVLDQKPGQDAESSGMGGEPLFETEAAVDEAEPSTIDEAPEWAPEPPIEAEVELEEEEEPVFEAGLPVGFGPEDTAPADLAEDLTPETFEGPAEAPPGPPEDAEPAFEVEPFYPPGADTELQEAEAVAEEVAEQGETQVSEDVGEWVAAEEDTFVTREAPFLEEPEVEVELESSFEPEGFVEGETPFLAEEPGDAWPSTEEAVETTDEFGPDAVETVAEEPVEVAEEYVTDAVETVDEVAPPLPTPSFGRRDPDEKAQRLARVLVSDIILYNPDRHQQASETGRLREEFEEEIQKSWNEYVEQVGEDVANNTSYFNDALNEILARGQQVF